MCSQVTSSSSSSGAGGGGDSGGSGSQKSLPILAQVELGLLPGSPNRGKLEVMSESFRYSRLPDGRILDSAPMAKGDPILEFSKGAWKPFKGTLGEWRHSKPLTDSEAAALTGSGNAAQYSDRLTPSEIESLRKDKRDTSKRLREISQMRSSSSPGHHP